MVSQGRNILIYPKDIPIYYQENPIESKSMALYNYLWDRLFEVKRFDKEIKNSQEIIEYISKSSCALIILATDKVTNNHLKCEDIINTIKSNDKTKNLPLILVLAESENEVPISHLLNQVDNYFSLGEHENEILYKILNTLSSESTQNKKQNQNLTKSAIDNLLLIFKENIQHYYKQGNSIPSVDLKLDKMMII